MNCINKLQNMIKHLPNNYPNIDNDINYIWNTLPEEMEHFTDQELIDNNYEINRLVITYLMELIIIHKKINVKYEIDEMTSFVGTAAYDKDNNKVLLSVMGMMLKADNTTSYLHTIFHELRHKTQHDFYKEDDINKLIKYDPELIMTLKHHIYEEYHQDNNREFYNDNYKELYSEVDAELYALTDIEDLINELIKSSSLKEQLQSELQDIKNNININPQASNEVTIITPVRTYFHVGRHKEDSLVLIDRFIKDNPILKDKYKALSILFVEYRPKRYDEIIRERNNLLREYRDTDYYHNIYRLYQNIIRTDPMYQLRDYLANNNIEEANEFLVIHPNLSFYYTDEFVNTLMNYKK